MAKAEKSRIFSVLGMHRSGTSALAGALSHAGIEFGDNLMNPAPGENDKGFWEDQKIVWLHDRLLAAMNSSWDDIRALKNEMFAALHKHEARNELFKYLDLISKSNTLGIKDPRLSILLPIWKPTIDTANRQFSFLISLRNPYEVISSLSRRDNFHPTKSALLYLKYYLSAERNSRDYKRIAIDYNQLVNSPAEIIKRALLALDIPIPTSPWEEAVQDYISPTLYRNRAESASASIRNNEAASLANELYEALSTYTINSLPIPKDLIDDIEQKAEKLVTAETCSLHIIDLSKRVEQNFLKSVRLENELIQAPPPPDNKTPSPTTNTTCQLFIASDSIFHENLSLQHNITLGYPTTVTFYGCENIIPHGRVTLRLDPSCCTGFIAIQNISVKIKPKAAGPEFVQLIRPVSSSATMIHIDPLKLKWIALDEDPQLNLDELNISENSNWSVEVSLTVSNSIEIMANAANEINGIHQNRKDDILQIRRDLDRALLSFETGASQEQQRNTVLSNFLQEASALFIELKQRQQQETAKHTEEFTNLHSSHVALQAETDHRYSELRKLYDAQTTSLTNTEHVHSELKKAYDSQAKALANIEGTYFNLSSSHEALSTEFNEANRRYESTVLALKEELADVLKSHEETLHRERQHYENIKQTLTAKIAEQVTVQKADGLRIESLTNQLNDAATQTINLERDRDQLAQGFGELQDKHKSLIESLLAQNEVLLQFRERSQIASMQLRELREQGAALRASLEQTNKTLEIIRSRPLVKLDALLQNIPSYWDESNKNEHHRPPVL